MAKRKKPLDTLPEIPDEDIDNINADGLDAESTDSIELFEKFLKDIVNGIDVPPEKKITLGFQAAKVLIELKKKKADGIENLYGKEDMGHLTDAEICRLLNRESVDRFGNIETMSSYRDYHSEDQSKKSKDFKLPEETLKDEEAMEAFGPDDIENNETEDLQESEEGVLPA